MINIYYKKLTESIEKQYLREAWADSMPNWMKPRLNATAMYADRNSTAKLVAHPDPHATVRQRAIKKGQGSSYDRTDYAQPRNDNRVGQSLYQAFVTAGIDLQNAKFIEGPIPEKKSDARLQAPNIPIWNIPSTGQVYAKGINDLEKLNSGTGTKYDGYRMEYLPIKALAELSDHFCYIDGSTIPTKDYEAQKTARNEYRKFAAKSDSGVTDKERRAAYLDDYVGNLDKSGYVVIPSSVKYADKLQELHAKSWATKVTRMEEQLRKAKAQIISTLNRTPVSGARSNLDNAQNAIGALRNATYYYEDMLNDINNAFRYYGQDSSDALKNIGSVLSDEGYSMRNFKSNLNNIDRYVSKLAGVELDF